MITDQLVMKLVAEGKLSLDDKVSKYYPELVTGRDIDIKNLLNMTSGLVPPQDLPNVTSDLFISQWTADNLTSDGRIGKWNYIDENYVLLAGIVKITGESCENLFNSIIKGPLGLINTNFDYNPANLPTLALGYRLKNGAPYHGPVNETEPQKFSELGAGNIAMTPLDFYRLVSSIIQNKVNTLETNELLRSLRTETSGYSGGMYVRNNYFLVSGLGYGFDLKTKISRDGQNAVIFMSNSEPLDANQAQAELVANIYKLEFGI